MLRALTSPTSSTQPVSVGDWFLLFPSPFSLAQRQVTNHESCDVSLRRSPSRSLKRTRPRLASTGAAFKATAPAPYLTHPAIRSSLYPGFVDLLDRSPGEPRAPESRYARPRVEPESHYAGVVHAQRLLLTLALGALSLVLSSERYCSQVSFAEYLALPFALAVAASLRRAPGAALAVAPEST